MSPPDVEIIRESAGRPDGDLPSTNHSVHVPGPNGPETITVILGYSDGALFEVFLRDAPNYQRATADGLARMVSVWLQAGGSIERVIDLLENQADPWTPLLQEGGAVKSLPDALAKLLKRLPLRRLNERWEQTATRFARRHSTHLAFLQGRNRSRTLHRIRVQVALDLYRAGAHPRDIATVLHRHRTTVLDMLGRTK